MTKTIPQTAPPRPSRAGTARGPGSSPADELAGTLHLTWQSAAGQIAYACTVAARLPKTFAALAAGLIHPVHVRIIEDETRFLSDADAATADEELAQAAASSTFGQLRYAAHRLVLKLDPDAALRRKDDARADAHVRRFLEDSGNAGMIARELPPDEVLASWQHVEQRALDLRAAGMPGTLRELRVRAYLADPPPGLVSLGVADAFDLVKACDRVAHVPGVGQQPIGPGSPGTAAS